MRSVVSKKKAKKKHWAREGGPTRTHHNLHTHTTTCIWSKRWSMRSLSAQNDLVFDIACWNQWCTQQNMDALWCIFEFCIHEGPLCARVCVYKRATSAKEREKDRKNGNEGGFRSCSVRFEQAKINIPVRQHRWSSMIPLLSCSVSFFFGSFFWKFSCIWHRHWARETFFLVADPVYAARE